MQLYMSDIGECNVNVTLMLVNTAINVTYSYAVDIGVSEYGYECDIGMSEYRYKCYVGEYS